MNDHFNPQLERQLDELEDLILITSRSPLYKLNKWSHSLMDRSRSAAEISNQYVHDRPWSALMAAACTGILLGAIVRSVFEKTHSK